VMQTFTVDVASQELKERQNDLPMPSNVVEALRTRHYFALKQEDQVMFYLATDVQQQVFLGSAHDIETSLLDDMVLVRPHNGIKPRFFSVALNKEEKLGSVVESTCTVSRALESETIDIKEKELLYYAVQCKNFLGLFSMRTANPSAVEVVFKTQGGSKLGTSFHGFLRKAFRNSNSLIVQLGDLTLHLMDIEKVLKVWTREEGLSQIKQVEVIQQKAVRIESELEYVKNVKEAAGISTVTSRILNRYKENLNYLVNHLSGIVTPRSSAAVKDSLDNLFGFKKVFLMLTDVGRLVALSATDGKVQWAEYFGGNVEKVIVRNILDSEIKEKGENTQTQQIAVILNDEIRFLDPKTG
jgi:glycerol-3-phosphate responsive antiterminator